MIKTSDNVGIEVNYLGGFPDGSVVKNPPDNARTGSIPGLGRSHMP